MAELWVVSTVEGLGYEVDEGVIINIIGCFKSHIEAEAYVFENGLADHKNNSYYYTYPGPGDHIYITRGMEK